MSAVPDFDPAALGIDHPGPIWANLSAAVLTEHAVRRGEAQLTDVLRKAGFGRVRRACASPFNLILEVRR